MFKRRLSILKSSKLMGGLLAVLLVLLNVIIFFNDIPAAQAQKIGKFVDWREDPWPCPGRPAPVYVTTQECHSEGTDCEWYQWRRVVVGCSGTVTELNGVDPCSL